MREKYEALAPVLTERARRLWAASEARALGHGGIAQVVRATGISRSTVEQGMRELESDEVLDPDRTRRPGGGRNHHAKRSAASQRSGGPGRAHGVGRSPFSASLDHEERAQLAEALQEMGHEASHTLVATMLHELGYSLQANRKTRRDASTRTGTLSFSAPDSTGQ